MGRLAHSWHLFKTSLNVVKQDKELMLLPLLSFLAAIVTVAAIAGVGYVGKVFPQPTDGAGHVQPLAMLLGFLLYVGLAFVGLFFNAAVVAGATERLAGGNPTLGSSLRAASKKTGRLLAWSIVVATVNVILQVLRNAGGRDGRGNILGQILAGIAGAAWNLATYFVIPVLLFENEGMTGSFKRSASLFKKTWGESVAGSSGIGLIAGVLTFVFVILGVILLMTVAPLGAALFIPVLVAVVLGVVFLSLFFGVVSGVYKAALYRYATAGEVGGGFSNEDLTGAWTPAR